MTTAGSTRASRLHLVVAAVVVLLLGPLGPLGLQGASAAAAEAGGPDPVGVWPLSPVPQVVRGFDPPGSVYGPGHRGVDLLGGVGQTVHTALAGRVTYAGMLAGRGVVVVDHGTTRTTYEPVDAGVHVGEQLARGAPIGTLALTGSHCFPRACLHWGWIADPDTYLDPLGLVGGGPVRLLPLDGAPAAPAATDSAPLHAAFTSLLGLLHLEPGR